MRVSNPGPAGSKILFGVNSDLTMGTDSAGNFVIQQTSAAQPLMDLDSQKVLHIGSSRVEAQSLDAVAGLSVRGVPQWQLVFTDDFSTAPAGWSRQDITKCR